MSMKNLKFTEVLYLIDVIFIVYIQWKYCYKVIPCGIILIFVRINFSLPYKCLFSFHIYNCMRVRMVYIMSNYKYYIICHFVCISCTD